jgi:uncharacterized protein YutD
MISDYCIFICMYFVLNLDFERHLQSLHFLNVIIDKMMIIIVELVL